MATKKKYILSGEGEAAVAVGLSFTFDDETVVEFDFAKVPEQIKVQAMNHGFSQKLGDSYAAAKAQENPLAWAKAQLQSTIEQLYAGDWRAARESSGAAGGRITDLAVALSRLTGKTVEESQAFVDTLDDDQKKAWKAKGKVKAMLALIAAEKAAARAKKLAEETGSEEEGSDDSLDMG